MNMIKARRLIQPLVLLLMVALYAPFALAESQSSITENKGFLWKISDSNSSIYLLGSVHFANADYYPMSRAINAAFKASDTLAVEIDINSLDPTRTQQLLLQMGHYQDQRTVKDELSPATYQKLEAYLANAGLPIHLVEKQKPGMLIISLTSRELTELGMVPEFGIDQHFLTLAKGNKPIVQLETLQQQLDLLLNIEDPDQAMIQSLEEFPTFPDLASRLFNAWQSGDTSQIEQLLINEPLQKHPDSKAFFDKMFTARNLTMSDKIKGYLAEDRTVFVVVGAGHLIGEGGIVNLLEKKDFTVQRQ
jgi:uncharacterized protein YbaP (TraB family)